MGDRTETTNVALQNKDIVHQIIDKHNTQFRNIDPQAASVYYMFANMYKSLEKISKAGILLMPVLAPSHALISGVKSMNLNHQTIHLFSLMILGRVIASTPIL